MQAVNQVVQWVLRLMYDQFLKQALHEVEDLLVLEVLLNVLLVFKFGDLIHF